MEEAFRSGIATNVLVARMAFKHLLNGKHETCITRARDQALRQKGMKAAQ